MSQHVDVAGQVAAVIAEWKGRPGALLPILHGVQKALGNVPESVLPQVAQALNLSRAEVHGVVSFYHDFRREPAGQVVVRICRAESCQAMGCADIESAARNALGIDFHETTPDGAFTLEPVYCLGHCACSPALMIGDVMHARVTPEGLYALLDDCRKQYE